MRPIDHIGLLVAMTCLSALPALSAEQAPKPLLGHSVVSKWTEARSFEPAGDGGVAHQDTVLGSVSVYVDIQGNVLGRFRNSVSVNIDGKSVTNSSSFEGGNWRFDGPALVGDYVSTQGVMRISIAFANGYRDCSLAVIYGKPKGKRAFIVEGWMREHYLLESARVTSQSCSVQAGNALSRLNRAPANIEDVRAGRLEGLHPDLSKIASAPLPFIFR